MPLPRSDPRLTVPGPALTTMAPRWPFPASPSISTTHSGSRGPCSRTPRRSSTNGIVRTCPDIAHAHSRKRPGRPPACPLCVDPRDSATTSPAPACCGSNRCSGSGGTARGSQRPVSGVFREHRNAVTLFDDVTHVLERLGERYAIGAINTTATPTVHHIGIAHHFDFVVTPSEAGAAKPDPRHLRAGAWTRPAPRRKAWCTSETIRCATSRAQRLWGCALYG